MGSENHPVQRRGIYCNLPTFDESFRDLTAIVTGANGISGFSTMRVLLESPQRWTKIYALSRRPPPKQMMALLSSEQQSRVQHVAVDFLDDSEKIVEALKSAGVDAHYVFFYSYLQPKPPPGSPGSHAWSNADELVKVNKALFGNFLEALQQAKIQPRRVLLQTGAKNYGVHIGRHRTPACESDPQPAHLEPNFYYPQEELLFDYCKSTGACWNVIHPAWIIGAVTTAQINGFMPFAVYAAVQAYKSEPIAFPGDWEAWQFEAHHATARLTGYLSEWAVLEDKSKNERFNAQDTSPLSWDRFFEQLAEWFGVKPGVIPPSEDDTKYQRLTGKRGKEVPLGYGPPTVTKFTFSLVDWASQPENHKAWKELMAGSNGQLTDDPFEDPQQNFQMGNGILGRIATMNMNKARRLGWTGYVDTIESVFEMYQENAKLGLIPEMVAKKPRPLI